MITPEQCRAARGWLDWSQEELASRAEVALSTIRDFEKGRRLPIGNNVKAIQDVLAKAGFRFEFNADEEPAGVVYSHRIKERDTYIPVLTLLDDARDGFMTTSDLIQSLEVYMRPSGEDLEILDNRSDARFTQIVRNIISHRSTPTNLIGSGWVIYDAKRRGLQITQAGRMLLAVDPEQQRSAIYNQA